MRQFLKGQFGLINWFYYKLWDWLVLIVVLNSFIIFENLIKF